MLKHLFKVGQCLNSRSPQTFLKPVVYRQCLLVRYESSAPAREFSQDLVASWPPQIRNFLAQERIERPTLIQERTLPIAMENRDLVGIARTGSGKTLAFVIPAVMKILKERESRQHAEGDPRRAPIDGPTCLVLAPTRELATQTNDVFRKFRNMGIKSIVLVGGASRSAQIHQLQDMRHDVYIATPGRLKDLMDSGLVDLSNVKYLVLDEADRMLDMGFEPQIRAIIQDVPRERQTLMWSATWPREIQQLARQFMKDYEHIAVDGEKLQANPNINQVIEVIHPREKLRLTLEYLEKFKKEVNDPRVLIFVNTKRLADQLIVMLMRNRYRAVSMHGDRSQRQRDDALRLFKNRQCNIMVATDVAARGLDISDISHIINFEFPNNLEDYIHRIGRTARHEKKGTAVSFLTENNAGMAKKLIRVLQETNQEVPDKLRDLATNDRFIFR